jgi:hypothetical protein
MITRIELFNPFRTSTPDLTLVGSMPHDDPVQLLNIDGLDPVTSEISSTPFATGRGELFQGASTPKRNLVFTLGLNPNWENQTIASLRKLLYAYLMPELWVRFRFFTDDYPPCQITGIVESFEPNIFSQEPEIQVSVICPKPDFVAVDATLINGIISAEYSFDYLGTVSTGFELRIKNSAENPAYTGNLEIRNETLGRTQKFEISSVTIDSGRSFLMNTVKSSRRVENIYDNGVVNILSQMVVSSDWPELLPGDNLLHIIGEEAGQEWRLGYFNRYGGL